MLIYVREVITVIASLCSTVFVLNTQCFLSEGVVHLPECAPVIGCGGTAITSFHIFSTVSFLLMCASSRSVKNPACPVSDGQDSNSKIWSIVSHV